MEVKQLTSWTGDSVHKICLAENKQADYFTFIKSDVIGDTKRALYGAGSVLLVLSLGWAAAALLLLRRNRARDLAGVTSTLTTICCLEAAPALAMLGLAQAASRTVEAAWLPPLAATLLVVQIALESIKIFGIFTQRSLFTTVYLLIKYNLFGLKMLAVLVAAIVTAIEIKLFFLIPVGIFWMMVFTLLFTQEIGFILSLHTIIIMQHRGNQAQRQEDLEVYTGLLQETK